MYNRADKIRYFNKLRNPSAAQKDLQLLKKSNPSLSRLGRYGRNPERYADDILYDLLDTCTEDKIAANRGDKTADTETYKPTAKSNTNRGNGSKKNGSGSQQTAKKPNSSAKSTKTVKPKPTPAEQVPSPTPSEPETAQTEPTPPKATAVEGAEGEDAKKK